MVGNIYIKGTIGDLGEGEYTELVDVVAQVNQLKEASSYKVHINTIGGYTYVAKQITDYLKSLNKPLHTFGHGIVASSGTMIYAIGDIRELENDSTQFMIHLPSGGIQGTSKEILEYSNMMQEEQNKIIDIYAGITGLSNDVLEPLVTNETWITAARAYELGFSTVEPVKIKAVAMYNKPINKNEKMSEQKKEITPEDKKVFKSFMAKMTALFNPKEEPVNLVMQTADADVEIEFTNLTEGESVVVEATATINGAQAQGEHVMPTGETYVFNTGVLTEIKPKKEVVTEENEFTQEELDEITALIQALEAVNVKAKADLEKEVEKRKEAVLNLATVKKEFMDFKENLKSNYNFEEMQVDKDKEDNKVSGYAQVLAKIKNKK